MHQKSRLLQWLESSWKKQVRRSERPADLELVSQMIVLHQACRQVATSG
jgi:hypothetical protein